MICYIRFNCSQIFLEMTKTLIFSLNSSSYSSGNRQPKETAVLIDGSFVCFIYEYISLNGVLQNVQFLTAEAASLAYPFFRMSLRM